MADQVINARNDIIQNVVPESWQKGACPPEWDGSMIWNDAEPWNDTQQWAD